MIFYANYGINPKLNDFLNGYGFFILFVVIWGGCIYFVIRRRKWCPKCKKPSCKKLGPKSMTDMQAMRCKICGFNKTIYTPSPSNSDHSPGPD